MEIKLTRGLFAVIDDIDADLSEYKWFAWDAHGKFYAVRNQHIYHQNNLKFYLHREVGKRIGIATPLIADHINGNSLDNRRCNLRPATQAENSRNRKINSGSTSGYKGVSWHKPSGMWQSRVYLFGKEFRLGLFNSVVDAAKAYDRKAIELHGEFARLNFERSLYG